MSRPLSVRAAAVLAALVPLSLVGPLGADDLQQQVAPPVLDMGQVFPGDGANTIHERQPLLARFVEEDRSRVEPASVRFWLTDLVTSERRAFEGGEVTYDSSTGIARTNAVSLTGGNRYRVELHAADRYANSGEWSWEFQAMRLEASTAAASIAGAAGELVSEAGEVAWKFVPRLDMGQFTVTATPTAHSGFGPIGHIVPLEGARIEYTLPESVEPLVVEPYPPGHAVTVYKQYTKLRGEETNTKTLYGQPVSLPPITVRLPDGASDPVLVLDVVQAVPTLPALDCPDPFNGRPGCTPDPLRFFMAEDLADDIFEQQQQAATQNAGIELTDIFVSLVQFVCGGNNPEDGSCLAPAPHWRPLHPGVHTGAAPHAPDVPAGPAAFSSPGSYQWVVPPDVLEIETWTAGGTGDGLPGMVGAGVVLQATIPVTPGETLNVVVGGAGRGRLGGFGGGGDGGLGLVGPCCGGGADGFGGGGGSRISRGSSPLVVSAGGGGMGGGAATGSTSFGVPSGGATTQGGDGGDGGRFGGEDGGQGSADLGWWPGGHGGKGATASAGGAGGTGGPDPDGQPGTANAGGAGGSASAPGSGGGGGGGGRYGGGGGEAAWYGGLGGGGGGGGGGVSYVAPQVEVGTVTTIGGVGRDGFVAVVPLTSTVPTSTSSSLEWDDGLPSVDRVDIDGLTYLGGVHYPSSFAVPTPEQFEDACAVGFPCVSNDVAAQPAASPGYACTPSPCPSQGGARFNRDVQQRCLYIDGYNRARDCTQQTAVFNINMPHKSGTNHIVAQWLSQIGKADSTRRGPPPQDLMRNPPAVDAFGVTWYDDNHRTDTRRKWDHIGGSSNQGWTVLFDLYYHEKDIPQCSRAWASCNAPPIPPHRETFDLASERGSFTITQASGSDAENGWGYGMAIPYRPTSPFDPGSTNSVRTTAQYFDVCGLRFPEYNPYSGEYCADLSGQSGYFWGYYNPDHGQPIGPRNGMARSYLFALDAEWWSYDAVQSGTFIVTWGHKWTEYGTQWKAGWSVGWGGPSFGLSWEPWERERADHINLPLRYCFGSPSC